MQINRTQQLGFLALFGGLALLGSSRQSVTLASSEEMMVKFGGAACLICNTIPSCGGSVACEGSTLQPGKFVKITTTGQGQAQCGTRTDGTAGPSQCGPVDTQKLCTTTTYCTDNACSMNCTSTTTTVPTNCPMSGNCQAG